MLGGTALLSSIIQGRLAMSTCQRGIKRALPPPGWVLLRADSHQSTQQTVLNKWELRKGSMKKGQMLPWGQAARGPLCPLLALLPWPVLSSSLCLQHLQLGPKLELHLSEALLRLPFPELGGPQGGGRRTGLEGREGRTGGRVSWSRQRWGQNWEFLGRPQLQAFCPII